MEALGKCIYSPTPRLWVLEKRLTPIRYETKNTFQTNARANKSGDGTVPYCSLSYAEALWRDVATSGLTPLRTVISIEIEGAEHREMLNNPAVFDKIIDLVCAKPIR